MKPAILNSLPTPDKNDAKDVREYIEDTLTSMLKLYGRDFTFFLLQNRFNPNNDQQLTTLNYCAKANLTELQCQGLFQKQGRGVR